MSRPGVPLLTGAKISLGSIPITGRTFEDYKASEIAYIIMRFMKQNSEDGRTFTGAVSTIVTKNIWKEYWEDKKFENSKISKRIYSWLRAYGCRPRRNVDMSITWFLPDDIDDSYAQRTAGMRGETPMPPPSEVVIKCMLCGAGPFANHADFVKHKKDMHKEVSVEAASAPTASPTIAEQIMGEGQQGSQQTLPVEESLEMVACPTCQTSVTRTGLKGHLFQAHNQAQCRICGEVKGANGLGGHMQAHKFPEKQRRLLEVIQTKGEGRHPEEYSAMLNISNSAVSSLAVALKRRGLIRSEGHTVATRYFLTAQGRKRATTPGIAKRAFRSEGAKEVSARKEAKVAEKKQSATPKATAPGVPAGTSATIFETKDGGWIVVTGSGETFFAPVVQELKTP